MESAEKPPRKKRFSCLFILALCVAIPLLTIGLLLSGVVFLLCMPGPALVISEETTRITGPLTANGQIDFFKALEQKIYPPEFATDDNGFRIFVRTFGDVGATVDNAEYGEFYRLQKYEKLGLDPNIPPTLTFPREPVTIIRDFYKAKGEEMPPWNQTKISAGKPWTLEEYPMLAGWINEIDEPMNAIAEMLHKPVFFVPMLQSPESVQTGEPQDIVDTHLPDIQSLRSIAQILQARALYRIGQGDIDGAIDDKLALHRLGRLIAQGGFEILYLFGTTFENMGTAIPVGANPEHPLMNEQIQRILDGLDTLPPRVPIQVIIETDRYSTLSVAQAYMRDPYSLYKNHFVLGSGGSGTVEAPKPSLGERIDEFMFRLDESVTRICNWNVVFRRINEVYDELLESPTQAQWRSISATVEATLEHVLASPTLLFWTPDDRALEVVRIIFRGYEPPVGHLEGTIQRSHCAENMQRLALAILLYQHGHGELPGENWAEQIQKYLGDGAFGEGAEQYFSCPANPAASGETMYALVQYADTIGGSLLLVELAEALPLDKAVITADELAELLTTGTREVLECCGVTQVVNRGVASRINAHFSNTYVAFRSGIVKYLSLATDEAELLRLLGREEKSEQPNIQSIIHAIEAVSGAVERNADGTIIGVDLALERASATDEVLKLALTLPNLKKFRLAGGTISGEAFAELKTQSDLEELFLQDLMIREEEFLSVVSALPKLKRLTLRRLSNISDTGMTPLFQLPLRQLALIEMPLTGVGLQSIGDSSTLAALDIRNCAQLVPEDYKNLVRLPQLVDLKIAGLAVDDRCLEIIALLPGLKGLTLDDSLVSAQGFEKFATDSLSADSLETLVLNRNMSLIDDSLLLIDNFPRLKRLILGDAMVTGTFLVRLAENEQKRPKFNDLALRKTFLTEEAIASLKKYPELQSLQITGITLSQNGVETLLSLPRLERLDLNDCFLDEDVQQYLRETELPTSLKSLKY